MRHMGTRWAVLILGCASATALFFFGVGMRREAPPPPPPLETVPDLPSRPLPERFPAGTHLPKLNEGVASGSVDLETFSAGRDLTYIDDDRVWWESDHDVNDTECDHSIHVSLREPLERLIELVAARGATLKVQDAFRAAHIHSARSLHKEGRAIDLTSDDLSLEELAKLCWVAGFDWVYHEKGNKSNGPHVHASVKRKRN